MNFVYLIILLIITAGTLFNSIKWGRFAQREHYLPGSVTKFYFRWIRTKFINRFMFFISLILFVISLWIYYVPLLVVCLTIFSPLGINFKSRTGEIVITERLKRVNYLYYSIVLLISLVSYLFGYGYIFALIINLFSFFIYDQCLRILQSYEKNITKVFVNDASLKLNSRTLPVVGITGSYSKTTTKNVLNQILQVKNKTFVTPESYNNRLGIAKAINESFQNEDEIAIIEYFKEQGWVDHEKIGVIGMSHGGEMALKIVKTEKKASTSFLQRKLQIGYNRAARIIDQMENNGIISKANHTGKREVL